jgi:hypothetical protein
LTGLLEPENNLQAQKLLDSGGDELISPDVSFKGGGLCVFRGLSIQTVWEMPLPSTDKSFDLKVSRRGAPRRAQMAAEAAPVWSFV